MRVTVNATNFALSVPLRQYAESKVWLVAQRATSALAWAGVRLTRLPREGSRDLVSCQMNLWLKCTGLITVTHTDRNAEVAVDRAAARLEQTLRRKLGIIKIRPAGLFERGGRWSGQRPLRWQRRLR